MHLRQASLCLRSWQILARAMLALAFMGLPSVSMAEDEVMLSPAQIQSLGVRVTHPVSSRTDQTLPYPAQIVIPTPQLWVVSAPVAGMVTSLSVARGDRVTPGQRLVTLREPELRVAAARLPACRRAGRACHAAVATEHRTVRRQGGAATRGGDEPDRGPAGQHCGGRTAADASAQRAVGCGIFRA